MAIQVISIKDNEELSKKGASYVFDALRAVMVGKHHVVLGLPGGRSIAGLFEALANSTEDDFDQWDKVNIFLVDERQVPPGSKESNFTLILDSFARKLVSEAKLPKANLHPFMLDSSEVDKGLSNYNNDLNGKGGAFDVIVLGVGEDGHVAGLFPNHHSVQSPGSEFIRYNDSPKLPAERMSATRELLQKSSFAIVLFIGESKRQALLNFLNPNLEVEGCPVKLVESIPNVFVLTDIDLNENPPSVN